MKYSANVRHRPLIDEGIELRFQRMVVVLQELQAPWGLVAGKELDLPPVGARLSTQAKFKGKLGSGLSGYVSIRYRAVSNLLDAASDDDFIVIEFDANKFDWRSFMSEAFPGYVRAIGAYIGRVDLWDEMPATWRASTEICKRVGKDLDGRDGFFRFGPISYMDRELCRRGCNGLTPEQIVAQLTGVVPDVKLFEDGVLIVAAEHFPEQAEINATDRVIRNRLGLPIWTNE
jgi:hypothetical protein